MSDSSLRVSDEERQLSGSGWMATVRRLTSDSEARACARIMADSEPWLTLGRDAERSLAAVCNPEAEAWVAVGGGDVAGCLILNLHGLLTGYLQTIVVHPAWRSRGLGRQLIAWAEERIFRSAPNVFICVSTFNVRARALYERLGYHEVGVLDDLLVDGHGEVLFRKSIGSWDAFRRRAGA